VLAATIIGFGQLLQVSSDSIFNWIVPVAYLGIALIGFGWAVVMRKVRPEVYAAIGRGADTRVNFPSIENDFPHALPSSAPPAAPVGSRGYPSW